MIRLIATDLDDTLLDASSDITPRTLAALQAAMAAGCGISLSSGSCSASSFIHVTFL